MSPINLIRYLRETKGTAYVESPEFLTEICGLIGAQDLMLVDRDGNVISSAMGIFTDLKDETYAPLLQTFETGKLEKAAVYSFSAENMDKREKDYEQYWDDQIQPDGTAQSESDEVWGESYYGVSNMFPVFYASMIDEERACVINDLPGRETPVRSFIIRMVLSRPMRSASSASISKRSGTKNSC